MSKFTECDGAGDHKQIRISEVMKSLEGIRLHLKQGHRFHPTAFGEQSASIIQIEAPCLMDATATYRRHPNQINTGQWPFCRHQISPETSFHPREGIALASMN